MEPENIQEIFQRAKIGDKTAFTTLYNLYFTPVFRYIYSRTGNKQDTEDLTQAVFLKVFKNLSGFQVRKISPLAYFFTAARNAVTDHWRQKKELLFQDLENKAEKQAGAFTNLEKTTADIDNKFTLERLKKSIFRLSSLEQEVIILRFFSGFSYEEIAEAINKNEAAIRQINCRALKKLRKIIDSRMFIN